MKNYDEFVAEAINYGVMNDIFDVWVVVDGIELTVPVQEVLGREENTALESSYTLENNPQEQAWKTLYDQYRDVMMAL